MKIYKKLILTLKNFNIPSAGEASRFNIEPLAGIILALNTNYCENHSQWLREAVTKEICPRTTLQQRENFIRIMIK